MGASESSVAKSGEYYFPLSTSMAANFKDSPIHIVEEDGPVCCLLTSKLGEWIPESEFTVGRVSFRIESHDQGWCDDNDFLTKYTGSWTWFEAIIIRNFTLPEAHAEPLSTEDLDARIKQAINERQKSPVISDTEDIVTVRTSVGYLTTAKNHTKAEKDVWHIHTNMRASKKTTVYEVFWSILDLGLYSDMDDIEFMERAGSGCGTGFVGSLQSVDRVAILGRAKYRGWTNYVNCVEIEVRYSDSKLN